MELWLPRSIEQPSDDVAEADVEQFLVDAGKERPSILLIDDSSVLRQLTADSLRQRGFAVTCAGGGAEALAVIERTPHDFDVTVTDFACIGGGCHPLCAIEGIFPLIPSLDHVGPMARTVEDVALLWAALCNDEGGSGARVKKIGFDPIWLQEADAEILRAFGQVLELLKAQGIECQEVQLPDLDEVSEMHGRIFFVEGAAHHYANSKSTLAAIRRSLKAGLLQLFRRQWVIMSMHLRRGFDLPARSIACWRMSMSY